MLPSLLADLVVAVHVLFIAFVLFGGLLVRRWPQASWVHLPAVLWAVMIEVLGIASPLAPLERWLREQGGGEGIDGGIVERYLLPTLYPGELTRETQLLVAVAVIVINVAIYALVLRRRPMV